ncbi:hypothetical protein [Hymenobacter sp. GOD-10R]|uniref:hypothetical protein n=1 Tax=Hymenobacter sp. GOD-10R TaxID=3093922 RepID=UPI002D782109|nr:hypothetical protein [Hymenobacter sp. GOD-10R]WRQ31150.1 hypothetical protein SD425_12860 [Hymenobacter sp. GOD-10R]
MSNELETLKAAWGCPPPAPLPAADLRTLVTTRHRREQRRVGRYVVGGAIWQAMVYTGLAYVGWRYRFDARTLLVCGVGIALYLPFTTVFWRKFRDFAQRPLLGPPAAPGTLAAQIAQQSEQLGQFFRFKKRFDVVATPVTALVVVAVFIRVGWVPAITHSLGPALWLVGLIVAIFYLALRWENQHQFAAPLQRLAALQKELDTDRPPQ